MTRPSLSVRVDTEVSAAYIQISANPVARTVELNDDVYVDLDDQGMVRGVELLDLDAVIPYTDLAARCHVSSDVLSELLEIRPTVNSFIATWAPKAAPMRTRVQTRDLVGL